MSLQNLDPRWDNQTLEYNLDKHNWPEFWLAVAKEKFPNIESISLPDQPGNYRSTIRVNDDALKPLNWKPKDRLKEYIYSL